MGSGAVDVGYFDSQKLAVLIDADNASGGDLKAMLEEIAKYGIPTVKRAYGDWSSPQLAGWKAVLLENGAVPVQQYAYTTGKNATDAAMIIDAIDFLHKQRLDGFVLISSDSDFTPLALRIRESGLKVYGIGEKKTPKPFIKACCNGQDARCPSCLRHVILNLAVLP